MEYPDFLINIINIISIKSSDLWSMQMTLPLKYKMDKRIIDDIRKDEREKCIEEFEKMIDEIENPYPTDIFPEITDKAWKDIQKVLNDKFLGFPFDRISANLMRKARLNFKDEIKQQLKNLKEKGDKK